jgi:hypothetical protein
MSAQTGVLILAEYLKSWGLKETTVEVFLLLAGSGDC